MGNKLVELAIKNKLTIAGIMSGTSLDGVDVAVVDVTDSGVKVRAFNTIGYPAGLRKRMLDVCCGVEVCAGEIANLNVVLGEVFADAVIRTVEAAGISLKSLDLGISDYIRQLEGIGIELLKTLSITAERMKGQPGLWVGEKKIASLGVKVTRYVTYHGMAINLSNDLDIFKNIVPCGIKNVCMTSVQNETSAAVDMDSAKQTIADVVMNLWSPKA